MYLNDDVVLYSDVVVFELKKLGFYDQEINQMFGIAKPDHCKRIHSTQRQLEEATKISKERGVPLRDALHAILARDYEAQFVSRDWDFKKLKDVAKAILPEDIL